MILKELFRFTKRERIASLILLVLTMAGTGILFWTGRDRKASPEEFRRFDSLIQAITPGQESPGALAGMAGEKRDTTGTIKKGGIVLSTHDPNEMNKKDWQQLGLSSRLIRTITHYRRAGGKFRKKEDLKKIYGLTDTCYNRISGYLEVPLKKKISATKYTAPEKTDKGKLSRPIRDGTTEQKIEINRADSADFIKFEGVYPLLARRIVRYRHLLGGFVRKEQLLEVYGLNEEVFHNMEGLITVNPASVRKIDINRCQERTLAKHPYLTPYEAKAIIFYRSEYKHIASPDLLLKDHVIPEKTFRKIRPYLQVNDP